MKYNFRYGLKNSLTIVVGYAPVAITFGILAGKYGLSAWQAGLMSLLVYAGAAQFIAIEMVHQGATVWMIAITTLIVNIRHVLMSLSILPYFKNVNRIWSLALAQGLTDETFVLNTQTLKNIPTEDERRQVMLGINFGAFLTWVVFSFLGAVLGESINLEFSGFAFAMTALFIVLTMGTVNRKNVMTYFSAGLLAIIFKTLLPGKFYLILSVGLAAGIGAWIKQASKQKSEGKEGSKCA